MIIDKQIESHPKRYKTALYVDFDNVFSGLMELDHRAAIDFAEAPGDWLQRLGELDQHKGIIRDFLVRRCYLNPQGSCINKKDPEKRIYFSTFRPFLTRAGFAVIDCPALTAQNKNASDIRIVIDILDALQHRTVFDEFILLSSDADFTPVLQRVREHDRRTMIVCSSQIARAYERIADSFLEEQALINLIADPKEAELATESLAEEPSSEDGLVTDSSHESGTTGVLDDRPLAELREKALDILLERVAASSTAVPLGDVANRILQQLGAVVKVSKWFGAGTMTAALRVSETSHLRWTTHYVWDPAFQSPPRAQALEGQPGVLPPSVERVARVTGMPRLTREEFGAVFEGLASFLWEYEFDFTQMTAKVRDYIEGLDLHVGRNAIGFVARGAMYGGVRLDSSPAPDSATITKAFLKNVMNQAASRQLDLDAVEKEELKSWIIG